MHIPFLFYILDILGSDTTSVAEFWLPLTLETGDGSTKLGPSGFNFGSRNKIDMFSLYLFKRPITYRKHFIISNISYQTCS